MSAARSMTQSMTQLKGKLKHDEPMSRHTSWRVGGPASLYYQPANREDLLLFLQQLDVDQPLYWVGLGSNLLVRDGGVKGVVIAPTGGLTRMEQVDAQTVYAEVGVTSAKLARFTVDAGLTGGEFLAGIPGTVGGALAMNAGAFGGETWPIVTAVETVDRFGNTRRRAADEFRVSYRHVEMPVEGEWFLGAWFVLQVVQDSAGKQRIRELLNRRGDTQPTQQPNAGSVFKNPPGDHAARLIEQSGLKGFCIGKACVSDKHANFIINTGSATAAEIEQLIMHVRDVVRQHQGVELEAEVRIVGEPA